MIWVGENDYILGLNNDVHNGVHSDISSLFNKLFSDEILDDKDQCEASP